MSKQINTDFLESELKGSAFFGGKSTVQDSPTPPASNPAKKAPVKEKEPVIEQPIVQSITQSIDQSIDVKEIDHSPVMGKPRGFYITEKQNEDLDMLVLEISKRLGGKLPFKVDRSVLIRLILESSDLTNVENINKLATQLISRSISQLTG